MPIKSIVIVEDEKDTADLFAEMGRLLGYQVHTSGGGHTALAMIAEKKPSLVVLDVMIPDFSGLDILKFMRRDPRLAKIPVVIVSAKSLPADIRDGLAAGADDYLTKPVSFQDLRLAIERSIHSNPKESLKPS